MKEFPIKMQLANLLFSLLLVAKCYFSLKHQERSRASLSQRAESSWVPGWGELHPHAGSNWSSPCWSLLGACVRLVWWGLQRFVLSVTMATVGIYEGFSAYDFIPGSFTARNKISQQTLKIWWGRFCSCTGRKEISSLLQVLFLFPSGQEFFWEYSCSSASSRFCLEAPSASRSCSLPRKHQLMCKIKASEMRQTNLSKQPKILQFQAFQHCNKIKIFFF